MVQTDRYPHPHEHSNYHAFCSQSSYHRLFPRNHLLHESAFVFSNFDLGLVFGFDVEIELELGIGIGPVGILLNLD